MKMKFRDESIRRPQFTLRALLVVMLVVACFYGGVWFERERKLRQDIAHWSKLGIPFPVTGRGEPWTCSLGPEPE